MLGEKNKLFHTTCPATASASNEGGMKSRAYGERWDTYLNIGITANTLNVPSWKTFVELVVFTASITETAV